MYIKELKMFCRISPSVVQESGMWLIFVEAYIIRYSNIYLPTNDMPHKSQMSLSPTSL